jgi:hypothetical protein
MISPSDNKVQPYFIGQKFIINGKVAEISNLWIMASTGVVTDLDVLVNGKIWMYSVVRFNGLDKEEIL